MIGKCIDHQDRVSSETDQASGGVEFEVRQCARGELMLLFGLFGFVRTDTVGQDAIRMVNEPRVSLEAAKTLHVGRFGIPDCADSCVRGSRIL